MVQPIFVAFLHLVIIFMHLSDFVAARFCEGGHICSLPRECCTQGCCGPRQLPAPSEHVLNLFFISHWFFWCVVVALILAILCAYSLWKKRRTLCGWGLAEPHAQSEGDSAGSCYAPPQYSRCNSFHHPPPPYTEVTSKPDLYPLVFNCHTDNGKSGGSSSYLMVQYFRNYIVRPAGCSLSAASTMDSLSSSFIGNVNDANTLVPPPYSRAASPDSSMNAAHFQQDQQQHIMPRSASQLVCYSSNCGTTEATRCSGGGFALGDMQQQQQRLLAYNETNFALTPPVRSSTASDDTTQATTRQQHAPLQWYSGSDAAASQCAREAAAAAYQQQQLRYSSVSDIFVNSGCAAATADVSVQLAAQTTPVGSIGAAVIAGGGGGRATMMLARHSANSPPILYRNGGVCAPRPTPPSASQAVQRAGCALAAASRSRSENPVYNSCNSLGGSAASIDLQALRRSLETCCQMLQQQQQQQQRQQQQLLVGGAIGGGYVTSGSSCSGVSSLVNICTPGSPLTTASPTSNTDEVQEILDQIRQLRQVSSSGAGASAEQPQRSSAFLCARSSSNGGLQQAAATIAAPQRAASKAAVSAKRPATLQQQQGKRKMYAANTSTITIATAKPNKSLYMPMLGNAPPPHASHRSILKSPVATNFFFASRGSSGGGSIAGGRLRKGWITRSAPTTPGSNMPTTATGNNYSDDDSPLLNDHEEDAQGEQNAEYE